MLYEVITWQQLQNLVVDGVDLLAQLLPSSVDPLAVDVAEVEQLARSFTAEEIQLYYQIALTGRKELPFAPDGRAGLEMTLLRMLAFAPRRESVEPVSLMPRAGGEAVSISPPPRASAPEPVVPAAPVTSRQSLLDEQAALMAQAEQLTTAPTADTLSARVSSQPVAPEPAVASASLETQASMAPPPQPEQSLERLLQRNNFV